MQEKQEEDPLPLLTRVLEVGLDEVGRGAVFGPVFSAVVVLKKKNIGVLKKIGVIEIIETKNNILKVLSNI